MDRQNTENYIIYPIRSGCRFIMTVAFVFLSVSFGGIIYALYTMNSSRNTPLEFVFCLIPVVLGFLFPIWGSSTYILGANLTFSEEKLTYNFLGVEGTTTWENMIALLYSPVYQNWILVLDMSLQWKDNKSKIIASLNGERFKRHIALNRFAALPKDVKDFEKTKLARDLFHYAPHLFKKEKR